VSRNFLGVERSRSLGRKRRKVGHRRSTPACTRAKQRNEASTKVLHFGGVVSGVGWGDCDAFVARSSFAIRADIGWQRAGPRGTVKGMAREQGAIWLKVAGRELRITHPEKLYFSQQCTVTKLQLVEYYARVAEGALRGIAGRPIVLKRFVAGAEAAPFYQKRAPESRPPWLRSVVLTFPSGKTAEEVVVDDVAGLIWIVNLGCLELHPHPIRAGDLDHPDELRVDLDPGPGVPWADVVRVALEVKALLDELGLVGFPKTSGSRGMHINVRIAQRWSFSELRNAALALAREVERRVPKLATSKWWKDERHGVFLDYNQNAKDRTTCSAYSVRPLPDARVSTPLTWAEVPESNPADFTLFSVPERFAAIADPHAGMDDHVGTLDGLLELSKRDAAAGVADAPWPGQFPRQASPTRAVARRESSAPAPAPAPSAGVRDRRARTAALLVIAKSKDRDAALAGLERWLHAHPEAAAHLRVEDILVDSMRGRSSTWTRVRVNVSQVPAELRPKQGKPDPDDEPSK
jgi:bifunctional non-homologous end joining protein LigD